ncbi:MAG: hypothetical protein ACRDLV_12310 [Solirubrobacteraceae bacterium]
MTSLMEFETWRVKPGVTQSSHDEIVRRWFAFVTEHREALFPEWRSTQYYREMDKRTGEPTGRYIMLFEYESAEARARYKERRKNWDGPYAAYKAVDPYQEHFDLESVRSEHWEPRERALWHDFS